MTTRTIQTPDQIPSLLRLIGNRKLPVTVTVTDGAAKTTRQNRTMFMWFKEVADQLGDRTAAEVQAECKLTIGVPLLRAENEAFRLTYDRLLRPMTYEDKLEAMMQFDLPITRLMTTKQHTAFLDAVFRKFTQQGVVLTMPEDGQ